MADAIIITPPPGLIAVPGEIKLTSAQRHAIGGYGIELMRQRISRHMGLEDGPLPPYSPHGPVYVPVFGRGTFSKIIDGEPITLRRTKKNLGGRFGLMGKDVKAMFQRGTAAVKLAGKRQFIGPQAKGPLAQETRSRKSMKFANREAYKRALGKSGKRDLEESGRMLNAMTIVANEPDHITLGFSREEEQLKALGNQRISPWFGLSPNDVSQLTPFVTEQVTAAIIPSMKKVAL